MIDGSICHLLFMYLFAYQAVVRPGVEGSRSEEQSAPGAKFGSQVRQAGSVTSFDRASVTILTLP